MKKLSRYQEKTLALALGFVAGFISKATAAVKRTKPSQSRRHYDGVHTRKTRDSRPPHVRFGKENQ